MGVFQTIKEAKKKTEDINNRGEGTRKSFVNLKDKEAVRLMFLQELALDGKNYTEERGVAQVIEIHRNPLNFKKQAACTMEDEGQCWACEQITNEKESYKWKAKKHLLVNVAVLDNGEWTPKILDTTFFSSHVGGTIIEMAEEFGSIMNREFKYSRKGSGLGTEFSLINLKEADEPENLAKVEISDLSNFKHIPYNDQAAYYLDEVQNPSESW